MNIRTSNVTALLILVSQILCAKSLLDTANSAYFNLRVVEAKESYEKVWTSPKSINEKTEAGKQLVKISW